MFFQHVTAELINRLTGTLTRCLYSPLLLPHRSVHHYGRWRYIHGLMSIAVRQNSIRPTMTTCVVQSCKWQL